MSSKVLTLLITLWFCSHLHSQNTVGILSQEVSETYEGYNLLFPHNQSNVYLLDNCGQIVHSWEDDEEFRPGNSVFLLQNGDLVKCKRARTSAVSNPIWAGGGGETVEIRTWENELLHSFTLNDSLFRLHHDVAPMPNGNILMVAWENKNLEESIAAGRNPDLMSQDKVWSEVILEWNPGLDSIVWQWSAWDHLIQRYDATKANFGQPNNHPELIDLNYDEVNGHPDWLHINAIDYNPILDQIVLSVPHFNEFWIIDHNTTTEEAAGEEGDLLYRWGNPQAYDRGASGDKKLYFQHDVRWIDTNAVEGDEDFGKISLFNNRLPDGKSSANIIHTMVDGQYQLQNGRYLPEDFERTLIYPETDTRAFSNALSSAQFLPNGNALLLAGRWGFAYEITPQEEVVWNYIVPVKAGKAVEQGATLEVNNNITFRIERYDLEYAAFEGRDLSPKGYWELNPNEGFCGVVNVQNTIENQATFTLFPNPATTHIAIETKDGKPQSFEVYDVLGKRIHSFWSNQSIKTLDMTNWEKGIYFMVNEEGETQKLVVQ
ncbi:MAG: aryl-sulfate sulfotransferase [Bacteroidota bacterium]